ncbi:hypothetical protein Ccrd_024173, partial [Cynara cardunculus var. scolymus]
MLPLLSSLFNAILIPTPTPTPTATVLLHFSADKMADSKIRNVINRIFTALLTCAFALGSFLLPQFSKFELVSQVLINQLGAGGAGIGIITGAIKGQTTETGLVRGAGVGAVTGAITALQLMEMMANGESFSK